MLEAVLWENPTYGILGRALETLSRATRRHLVQRGHPQASLSLQCRLLGLCRSTLYYRPRAPGPDELALMRRLDELYTAYPFYGSRQMSRHLVREGYAAGRDRSGD